MRNSDASGAPERITDESESPLLDVWLHAFRLARYLGASHESAEDIAQTVALHFFRRQSEIRNPTAWTSVVVVRRVRALRLRAIREEQLHSDVSACAEPDLRFERALRVIQLLRLLRPRDALFLQLGLAGWSHREIGAQTGVPSKSVGVYLARARDRAIRATEQASR